MDARHGEQSFVACGVQKPMLLQITVMSPAAGQVCDGTHARVQNFPRAGDISHIPDMQSFALSHLS